MRQEWRERRYRPPGLVLLSGALLALAPVLVLRSHVAAAEFPAAFTVVAGALLSAIVFMLSMAQRVYQDALAAVAEELVERDKALCDKDATGDPEPWHLRASREVAVHYPAMVAAALTPGQHRYRRACVQRRDRAAEEMVAISFSATWRVSAAMRRDERSDPDVDRVSEWVAHGLAGQTDALPPEALHACPWGAIGKTWRSDRQKVTRLNERLEALDRSVLMRLGVIRRIEDDHGAAPPALVDHSADALGSHLLPLDVASFLTLAIMSLSAAGVAYTARGLSWPWDPALWAVAGIVVVTLVYVSVMRTSLRMVGESLSKRLDRLTVPSLLTCETLLGNAFIEQTTVPGSPPARELEMRLACLVGAEAVPLRSRLFGEFHLWRAMELDRSRDRQRAYWDAVSAARTALAQEPPDCAEESDHERRLQSIEFHMHLELGLAESHLVKATAPGDSDGVALLALARTYELIDRVSGTDRTTAIEELVLRALGPVVAGAGAPDWYANLTLRSALRSHTWLWPDRARQHEELLERNFV